MRNPFFVAAGLVSLAIGLIGIFVPLLPTTPFLLLSAFCFERGSQRFHDWLLAHPWFGPPIEDWRRHRRIRLRYKLLAAAMITVSLAWLLLRH